MKINLLVWCTVFILLTGVVKAQKYSAELSTPEGSGPFPVIIISHGSGGLTPVQNNWSDYFNSIGYATITMDHYGPRGWSRGQRPPKGDDATSWRYDDLVAVLTKFKLNKNIDPKRIVLAGWSAGAALTMHGLEDGENVRKESGLEHPFKAGILFYPYMFACAHFDFDEITFPVIHVHGSEDATFVHCWEDEIGDMKSDKYELVSKVYEGAVHLFDSSFITERCRRVRAKRGAPYPNYELCYKYDEKVHSQSKEDIKAFLAKHLSN